MGLSTNTKNKTMWYLSTMLMIISANTHASTIRRTSTEAMPFLPTVPVSEASLTDFEDVFTNTSDLHHVHNTTALRPVFVFREYIVNKLEDMGQHETKIVPNVALADDRFIRDNELVLVHSINSLANILLKSKYNGWSQNSNATAREINLPTDITDDD